MNFYLKSLKMRGGFDLGLVTVQAVGFRFASSQQAGANPTQAPALRIALVTGKNCSNGEKGSRDSGSHRVDT